MKKQLKWSGRAVGVVVFLILLAACGLNGVPRPVATTAVPASLALAPGMEIGLVQTTVAGLAGRRTVNPEEPGGGILVTIETVEPGQSATIVWRRTVEQTVEETQAAPVIGVGTPPPTPVKERVRQEGRITATGLAAAQDTLLPIYWLEPGERTSDTSLMWLSQAAYHELKTTRRTRWSPDIITRLSLLPLIVLERLQAETTGRDFHLVADADFVTVELLVNGQRTAVQTIRAHDDFGNEYVILADDANPLILKFAFNAITTGAIGLDAGLWLLIKTVYSGYQVVEIRTPVPGHTATAENVP